MPTRQSNFFCLAIRGLHYFLLLILLAAGVGTLHAQSMENSSKLTEYLLQEKINLTLAINAIQKLPLPVNQADYANRVHENDSLKALTRTKILSFENFLLNQKKQQANFILHIKKLQQTPLTESHLGSQEKIEKINALIEINKNTINLLNENLILAHKYQELLVVESQTLALWNAKEQLHVTLDNIQNQQVKLKDSLYKLLTNNLKLQQEMSAAKEFNTLFDLEARLLLNNQIINLTHYKISELDLQKKIAKTDFILLKNPDIRTLQRVTDAYKEAISQLSHMEQSLKKMVNTLKTEHTHLKEGAIKQQFASLIHIINSRISAIGIQEQTLQEDLENHQQELNKQLSVRQNLSEYRMDSWPIIFHQISRIPEQFYRYVKSLGLKIHDNYLWQDAIPAAILWVLFALIGFGLFFLNKLVKKLTQNKERSRLSGHLYDGILILLSRNMPYLSAACLLWVLFYFNHVSFANYQLLADVFLVALIFRTLILIARISLMERMSDASGKDVRLYHRFKWLLIVGGWITALLVFSHELPLPLLLQDIFNRLFMLFLVAASLVLWLSREVITHLLQPLLQSKKRYLRNAVMLLMILTPVTLFVIAVIGLVGYINLAWTLTRYQVQILLIITAYVLLRGLLFDALELLSECMISTLKNGWLWIEVILKPLDKILRVLLLIFSAFLLFQWYDLNTDSTAVVMLLDFATYPLVNLSGIHITPLSIIEFLILLSVVGWMSKWTREFCFRWLYRNANDTGIRNSLSVFTQYAVILVGGFITLRVLGLDFSGMSMVLGGLAVGMGFGLRDFASNIVGGIMLLIERPVREGDLITLGNYEGRVAHIGIRSMRVSSWDNMEVLIPNAETFNKPFTNWTHQDSIVRTVVPIKVCRSDDPIMIQQLILDVLAIIPEIVDEPPSQVFLKQIDEALVEFEVRYFINVQYHTRFEIRSKVLFAIMAQFQAAGVKAPIPPISVEIKEGKSDSKHGHYFPNE